MRTRTICTDLAKQAFLECAADAALGVPENGVIFGETLSSSGCQASLSREENIEPPNARIEQTQDVKQFKSSFTTV